MHVEFRRVDWPFVVPFRISYQVRTAAETVWVELHDGQYIGRGEALGVSYHGESADSVLSELEGVRTVVNAGITRESLRSLLPPGGARNAMDCALWDLQAKRTGRRAWQLAGIDSVSPLRTAFTLGLDSPETMARAAAAAQRYSLLKLKLGGEGDIERVRAVRQARPDVKLIVDANQAWNERQLRTFTPVLRELGVQLIEQPLPAALDALLVDFDSAVPLCADESCQTADSLPGLHGKYDYVNIKLDKTGGLTEALRLAQAARGAHFKLMVGCMGGSSLSMAPAFIIGQYCDFVDLDGPLLASRDVADAIHYEGSDMSVPPAALWG
jgi:L-alanine-DL-glutamate epimerase-like enolase superfamily enzyme